MNAIDLIATGARSAGYRDEAVVRNYTFADVLDASTITRTANLAIFTQTPPSYRSAALAAITTDGRDAMELVNAYRALGAPLLFVISADIATLWQVRSTAPPRVLHRVAVADLPELFERNRDTWRPESIHRAKSIGAIGSAYQLDFVDIGLLPAIEGEIHTKLDRLLTESLAAAKAASRKNDHIDTRLLFRVVFRLLAAKVLQDRGHPWSANWNPEDLFSILNAIESYYSLQKVPDVAWTSVSPAFQAAWNVLRRGINFSNISSDDLAFVYENTLITPETRKLFGTHSTPRQVAEYIVQRLELHAHNPNHLKIYEPFSGAGVFLVSALRHLRDLLPTDWSDQQRHDFLIRHLAGDDIEAFACEVAKLSLILADYPNHNGWQINEVDLFANDILEERLSAHNIILCNPPFEAFSSKDQHIVSSSFLIAQTKPVAILNAVLDARPLALGFVLPRTFIVEKQFSEQRRRIEQLYRSVEIVELPDRIFNASSVETSLLIAREQRGSDSPKNIIIRSTEVTDQDRSEFLRTGRISTQRTATKLEKDVSSGDLWIPSLADLWDYLADYPKIGSLFDIHLGARWKYDQHDAVSLVRKKGFRPGLFNAEDVKQFGFSNVRYLDLTSSNLTHAVDRRWDSAKIIANAVRLSRGPWRLAAAVDKEGLAFSQQLLGLWPKDNKEVPLEAYAAVLNGPLANAFFFTRFTSHRFRLASFADIPIPPALPLRLNDAVKEYTARLSRSVGRGDPNALQSKLLNVIDALVLSAYDLPLRYERELLALFRGANRPVFGAWQHWDDSYSVPGLSLAEVISGRFRPEGNWPGKVFTPLPEEQAQLLRLFGD